MPIAENFRRRGRFSECAFVFPNAPNIPITVVWTLLSIAFTAYCMANSCQNFGMEMPGWYDIVRQRVRLLMLSAFILS